MRPTAPAFSSQLQLNTHNLPAFSLANGNPKERPYSTYLYRRGNLYYFRYTFPDAIKTKVGRAEFRISLKTAYLREAKHLAAALLGALKIVLTGDFMLTYQEIRSRIHRLLQEMLLRDGQQFGPRGVSIPELDLEISPVELYTSTLDLYRRTIADESLLLQLADSCVPQLIKKGLFTQEEVTEDNKILIARAFGEMEITLHDILRKKEEGDFLAEAHTLGPLLSSAAPAVSGSVGGTAVVEASAPTVLYSQAMEKYIQDKLDDGRWKEHSLPDHKNRLNAFLEIMGDLPVNGITDEEMREFRNTLRRLPPNRSRSKAYMGKSVAEILAMKPAKTLDVSTVNITVEAVGSLLEWCVNKRYTDHNPARGLQLRDTRQAIELRDPFSKEDLELIFAHPKFSRGEFKYPAYFWIPLIGLYTGMRLEEIAQMHCADVYESDSKGIWVFDINERGEDEHGFKKTVKNINATRLVPIHDDLLELGLLGYHKSVASKGHKRLFPELTKSQATAKYGKQPGKQFKAVVASVLDEHAKKSFHSLRHTFANFYKQRGWQNDAFRQLYGHEIPELSANQYGGKFPAELLYREVIAKLDYGLGLPEILMQAARGWG